MIRVASLVSYQIFPAKMGGQRAIYFFLKYLARHCDVICYTIAGNIPAAGENFRVKNWLSNHRFRYINPAYFFLLRRDFRREKITHLIIEHPYYGWLGLLLKWFAGVQLVVRSHNIESLRFRSTGSWWWRILWWYEKITHQAADASFFITEEDRQYAIAKFRLSEKDCILITYGTELAAPPSDADKNACKKLLSRQYQLDDNAPMLLFNGKLNYLPNKKALDLILDKIYPMLKEQFRRSFSIFICGSELPGKYDKLSQYEREHIFYTGFVPDIGVYYKAATIFINPVVEGGGIKTKLVDALAYNCQAVSFANGAAGIPPSTTGDQLKVVRDNDVVGFCNAVTEIERNGRSSIPVEFYNHFYWDNIAKKAITFLINKITN